MDMKQWVKDQIAAPTKKALPILTFPAAEMMGITTKELIYSPELQANAMMYIHDHTDMAAVLAFMDLSVEAEVFGSKIVYSDDEVPTVVGSIIDEDSNVDLLKVPDPREGRTGVCIEGIRKIAALPKTPASAIATVTLVSAIACWINWGFGLIVGVILAKEIARDCKGVDYRLLIASAYSGFVVWHAGLSGSIPLTMATAGEALTKATNGALTEPVSVSATLFAPQNLIIVLLVIIAITVVNTFMHPKGEHVVTVDPQLLYEPEEAPAKEDKSPAAKLEQSYIVSGIVALLGFSFLIIKLFVRGGSLDLNAVIMLFLFTGILFHGTPLRYVRAFTKSAGSAAGIILQFPFYAGIMGIITGVGASGICYGTVISDACIGISTPTTFPLLTFLCAAVLNLFVPSGGGHWAIQAPVFFTAGANLGVDPGLTGISIAWGDAWTNLIQPFWALPALAIAKLNAKDIMGFCLIDLAITGLIICGGLLVWAM